QLANALLAGDIDAALVAEPVAEAKFNSIVAFEEEPVIVTSMEHPPIGGAGRVPGTMIVFEHGCPHRRRLEEWYALQNDMPERTIELGSYHAMLGSVLTGMGAALVPKSVIATFPESSRLRINTLPDGQNRIRTLLIWPRNVRSRKIDGLRGILQADAA
ncbi:MAG: LysR substrate-binding domain-containing protein, partial [Pseudomonadota bacterium]